MAIQDAFKKLNSKYAPFALLAVAVLIFVAFYMQVYSPKSEELALLEDQVTTLKTKVDQARVKARKLVEVKKATEKLEAELNKAKDILPGEEDTNKLIDKGLKEMLEDAGLEVKSIKRGKEVAHADNLYKEFNISLETDGTYHEMGRFMQELDSTERLLRVSSLNMSSAKLVGKEMVIPAKFDIIAYSAVEGKQ